MSSFTRRIQRQLSPSRAVHPVLGRDGKPTGEFEQHGPRKKFYMGRGQKLGVTNPKDPCRTGKRKAPRPFRAFSKRRDT